MCSFRSYALTSIFRRKLSALHVPSHWGNGNAYAQCQLVGRPWVVAPPVADIPAWLQRSAVVLSVPSR